MLDWVVVGEEPLLALTSCEQNAALFLELLKQASVNALVFFVFVFVFLQVESVNKLYNILTSETVDLVLRKSAAEQLTIVLQGEESILLLYEIK